VTISFSRRTLLRGISYIPPIICHLNSSAERASIHKQIKTFTNIKIHKNSIKSVKIIQKIIERVRNIKYAQTPELKKSEKTNNSRIYLFFCWWEKMQQSTTTNTSWKIILIGRMQLYNSTQILLFKQFVYHK
jgi:hypothetical protein